MPPRENRRPRPPQQNSIITANAISRIVLASIVSVPFIWSLKLKSAAARRSADKRPLKFTCYATALAEFAEWQQSRTTLQQYARFTQQDSFATDESAASAASVTSVDVAAAAPRWQHAL